jgi:PAS domain S-box-containing protein
MGLLALLRMGRQVLGRNVSQPELSRGTRLYIWGVILGGAGILAARGAAVARWSAKDILGWAALTAAISIVEQFIVQVRHGADKENFSLTEAIWAGALMVARPDVLTMAVAAGVIVGNVRRRSPLVKLAFNVGQYVVAITLANLIYRAVHPGNILYPRAWLGATLAMAAFLALNVASVALVISLVQRKRFLAVVMPTLELDVLHGAGNIAIGIVGAILWSISPAALLLLVGPMVIAFLAYRGWLNGIREGDRMRKLYEASQVLSGPLDRADFGQFVSSVRSLMEAGAAELVIRNDGQVAIHGPSQITTVAVTGPASNTAAEGRPPEAYIPLHPGLAPHVATVRCEGEVEGALAVHREEALTTTERSLLDTLASQVSVRLDNIRLYFETLEQRTQLEEIIAHSSNGIFVLSQDRRILSWNPAMERITGYPSAEAIDRRWEEILGPYPADAKHTSDPADESAPTQAQVQVVRPDGARRWVEFAISPVPGRDSAVKGSVVVARDATAELESEQLKADFVAMISHELRTPLTPLKGFLRALVSGTVDDSPADRQEYYRIMVRQTDRLERLITDLLEVSRIESGQASTGGELLDLTALVRELIEEFARSNPDRAIRISEEGGALLVSGDPFRLRQVVGNLLSNAVKFSPAEAPVDVRITRIDDAATVSVRDEGEGVPPSEQQRVFERFHRVENGPTRLTGGTGVGLFIARKLVEEMSGRIWLESIPGNGSTFSFSVPLATAAARAAS